MKYVYHLTIGRIARIDDQVIRFCLQVWQGLHVLTFSRLSEHKFNGFVIELN